MVEKTAKRSFNGLVLYFRWNIRKERNRQMFQNVSKGIDEVATLIRTDVELFQSATSTRHPRVTLAQQLYTVVLFLFRGLFL
jgi:hypothetical protein